MSTYLRSSLGCLCRSGISAILPPADERSGRAHVTPYLSAPSRTAEKVHARGKARPTHRGDSGFVQIYGYSHLCQTCETCQFGDRIFEAMRHAYTL